MYLSPTRVETQFYYVFRMYAGIHIAVSGSEQNIQLLRQWLKWLDAIQVNKQTEEDILQSPVGAGAEEAVLN